MNKLFCYGTLNVHAIQQALWGESKEGKDGRLMDYELKKWPNSAIFYVEPKPGEYVVGKVYELTDEQLDATDQYETNAYKRVKINKDDLTNVWVYARNNDLAATVKQDASEASSEEDDTKVRTGD